MGRALLLPSVHALGVDRCSHNGVWRIRFTLRPPPACRGAATRQAPRCGCPGWNMKKTFGIAGRRALSGMLVGLAAFTSLAHAVTPDEVLPDPKLEMRARAISQVLRCVVCQNQSIDDSNAPLAHDLRVLVRERLASGDTNEQALNFIVARYGNFVLLNPPMQLNTLALWLGPTLFVLIAAMGFGRYVRRRSTGHGAETPMPLTTTEQKR